MIFKNRLEAGRLLAQKLKAYKEERPLILGVPRGGVIVAYPIQQALGGQLDVWITRKIGAPFHPELAVGAVTGDGEVLYEQRVLGQLGISKLFIEEQRKRIWAEIKRRLEEYRGMQELPPVRGRLVILVDDGVATGFTLTAAIQDIKRHAVQKLVLAVPVGPPETFQRLREEVDKLVYLHAPVNFSAVGQFYNDFTQVTDEEVVAILSRARKNDQ